MAEQSTQTGTTSPQDSARSQTMQANEAQAQAGRPTPQGRSEQGRQAGTTSQQDTARNQEGRSDQGRQAGSDTSRAGEGQQGGGQQGSGASQSLQRSDETFPAAWGLAPFGMMSRVFEEFDRFFDELGFGRGRMLPRPRMIGERQGQRGMGALWAPQIEVSERDGQLVIWADLPGLRKEDLKVDLTDEALTIQGERQEQREGRGYSERSYGSFYRSIPLPEGVDTDGAQAKFQDGVLEVTIPMPRGEEQQKHKRLEIR
jgi:HSP20 family protein